MFAELPSVTPVQTLKVNDLCDYHQNNVLSLRTLIWECVKNLIWLSDTVFARVVDGEKRQKHEINILDPASLV